MSDERVDSDLIICGLQELAAQETPDGLVDGVSQELIRDTLELVKGQEPKLVNHIEIRNLDTVGDCPSCGLMVRKLYHPLRCGVCGQAVKWYD